MTARIAITPGEPAGIGPDLICQLAQQPSQSERVLIGDPQLIQARAKRLSLPITLSTVDWTQAAKPQATGELCIQPISCATVPTPGELNPQNSPYVLETLKQATQLCLNHDCQALVTGPVHKGVINEAGIDFTGHTEFLQQQTQTEQVVMLMASPQLKVALTTTHIPLAKVSTAITSRLLTQIINTLHQGLNRWFGIKQPHIGVCGLNPHAGEDGHLGTEEITTIIPCLESLKAQDIQLSGPFPADTIFIERSRQRFDVILAMYHDQGLAVIKQMAFDETVNVTLGLPFLRTSVDHGTALDLAADSEKARQANVSSFQCALNLAETLTAQHH